MAGIENIDGEKPESPWEQRAKMATDNQRKMDELRSWQLQEAHDNPVVKPLTFEQQTARALGIPFNQNQSGRSNGDMNDYERERRRKILKDKRRNSKRR